VLDEDSPLEADPSRRDAYTRAKLGQEEIARASAARGLPLRVLRPAYVYGPGRLFCPYLGVRKGRLELAMGAGPMALIPVAACAEALALATLMPAPTMPETFNVVDADAPDRAHWRAALPKGERAKLTLPVPHAALRAAMALLAAVGQGHRAPGLLREPVYAARFLGSPVRDDRLRATFGWTPRLRFDAVAAMPG
jgi:nucleoside-diphosphate-sugar epimerase